MSEEGEYDYGDDKSEREEEEEEEEYNFEDEKNIVNFAFKDIGDQGRAGGVVDEDLDIRILETTYRKALDPKTKFSLGVLDAIKNVGSLLMGKPELKQLKLMIHKDEVPLIAWKNPTAYVYGYYVHSILNDRSAIQMRLKTIQQHDTNINAFDVVKYAKLIDEIKRHPSH